MRGSSCWAIVLSSDQDSPPKESSTVDFSILAADFCIVPLKSEASSADL